MKSFQNACSSQGYHHSRASFRKRAKRGVDALERNARFVSSHFAFHKDLFLKRKGDFLFTWIRHPVNMFYSGCQFYRQEKRPTQYFEPRSVRDGLNTLKSFKTINDYIDWLLDSRPDHKQLFPAFYFDDDWGRYDFIGVCERHKEDTERLASLVDLPLSPCRVNVTSQTNRSFPKQDKQFNRGYREEELNEFFAFEIEIYEELAG